MIFSLKHVVFTLLVLVALGCKDDKPKTLNIETEEQIAARTISPEDIAEIEYLDYGLSQDSRRAVENWQKYNLLSEQIEYIKKADLGYFNEETELIKTFTKEFRAEMPKEIKSKEISARITALDTKIQKLNSLLRLSSSTKQEKIQGIKELLIAFRNLKLQINKKFEFEKNNVLRPE